jgi:hypothetical protein
MRCVLFALLAAGLFARPVFGQELAEMYRRARFQVQAERHFDDRGLRAAPLPPAHLPSRADTLARWLLTMRNDRHASLAGGKSSFRLDSWRFIRRFERSGFEKRFDDTPWAYLGTESLLPVDTTLTRDLRARLEAYFGPPTQTIVEVLGAGSPRYARDRYIQFEYWFVLNDSIPLLVMDVNGPLERGVIVSSDARYRDILLRMRESFFEEFIRFDRREAYVDYYYNPFESTWYYAGFDGVRYYLEPTRPPNVGLGRPWHRAISSSQ